MEDTFIPQVGRSVVYRLHPRDAAGTNPGRYRPAQIVSVKSEFDPPRYNLVVFLDGANDGAKSTPVVWIEDVQLGPDHGEFLGRHP